VAQHRLGHRFGNRGLHLGAYSIYSCVCAYCVATPGSRAAGSVS
jgi:hypothetical protein